jgi:hypothetical protein
MNGRPRQVIFAVAVAAVIVAAAALLTKRAARPVKAAPPAADTRGLDASGRTKAERLAIEEALADFKKEGLEGLLLRSAEDGDAAESDERRDLENVYGTYHPFFVRGDLDGDGRLDFAQAFVEKGSSGPWFHVAVFFGTADGAFQKPVWVERAISLSTGDLTIDRSLLVVTPDLALDPTRRWRWEAGERRFVDADDESGREPSDEDAPDETPDQKPRTRV